MKQEFTPEETRSEDLEITLELPLLDVTACEEGVSTRRGSGEPTAAGAGKDGVALPAPLPALDTLRDVETWLAEQDARAREYERALAELRQEHAESQACASKLASEVESAQSALQRALWRANEGERAVLDSRAAAQAAEEHATELSAQLEVLRSELAAAGEESTAADAELARLRAELETQAQQQVKAQQRQRELTFAHEERNRRVMQLQEEIAALNGRVARSERELNERARRLEGLQAENAAQQSVTANVIRERDALAQRIGDCVETLRSNEYQRSEWEGLWRELDDGLVAARTQLGRAESERAEVLGRLQRVSAQLSEREATIAKLQAQHAAQGAALEELVATRSREQDSFSSSSQESRVQLDALAARVAEFEQRHRVDTATLGARDEEIADARSVCSRLEEKLQALGVSDSARALRVAELEAETAQLVMSLRSQNEATLQAENLAGRQERELREERARLAALQSELGTAHESVSRQTQNISVAEATLAERDAQLRQAERLISELTSARAAQDQQLRELQAQAEARQAHAEAIASARLELERELMRVGAELLQETQRANTLDDAQRSLSLLLERTRGALDERELQLRRLERYASTSAQVLGRLRAGIGGRQPEPSKTGGQMPTGAALLPLDDSDLKPVRLTRRMLIGRAPESDLRLSDTSVSRKHAIMAIREDGAFIEDLHSANGIAVNRRRVRSARLADGDVIEIGRKRFRFSAAGVAMDAPHGSGAAS
jgi:chromosome segregation ATPase